MSRSTLRAIRRLKAAHAPIIEEYERRRREWRESVLPRWAEEHLLRVIAVFQYGEPQIDEPLAESYSRALSKLGHSEQAALARVRQLVEREPPPGDIRSKIVARIQQAPDWLRFLCRARRSIQLLDIEASPYPEIMFELLEVSKSDRDRWPLLPQGVLEPRPPRDPDDFLNKMSLEELLAYAEIHERPEEEWTRHEHRFVHAMMSRDTRIHEKFACTQKEGHGDESSEFGPNDQTGNASS